MVKWTLFGFVIGFLTTANITMLWINLTVYKMILLAAGAVN